MRLKRYSKAQLADAVSSSFSIAAALRKLKIAPAGGNYQTIKKAIRNFSLDDSHFTGKGHLRNRTHAYNRRNISEVLQKGRYENSHKLRLRLIAEGLKSHKCEHCNRTKWLKQKIPLQLHHVDGDKENNRINNLLLLCPNCHAVTDNYRGKNKRCRDFTGATYGIKLRSRQSPDHKRKRRRKS